MLDLKFKQFELKQMQIAMHYRMSEVKGWQMIEDELLQAMREVEKLPEEVIWNKDKGELISFFFTSLSNLQGIKTSTDGAERTNLINIARFTYGEVLRHGYLDTLKPTLDKEQMDSIQFIENNFFQKIP